MGEQAAGIAPSKAFGGSKECLLMEAKLQKLSNFPPAEENGKNIVRHTNKAQKIIFLFNTVGLEGAHQYGGAPRIKLVIKNS